MIEEEKLMQIVEAFAVIDIDPALTVLNSECNTLDNLVRINMAYRHLNHHLTIPRSEKV